MRKTIVIALLCALCLLGGWTARQMWDRRDVRLDYLDRRVFALQEQAARAPAGMTLIVGDSITEFAWTPTYCGHLAFNAGITAVTVANMIQPAHRLAKRLRPARVIVALGTNDARTGRETPLSAFRRDYEALVDGIGAVPLTLVGVMPFDAAMAKEPFTLNSAVIAAENAIIRDIARKRGALFVPPPRWIETDDGIHPTPAGSIIWNAAIEGSCPR
jgi:hypothetical protein